MPFAAQMAEFKHEVFVHTSTVRMICSAVEVITVVVVRIVVGSGVVVVTASSQRSPVKCDAQVQT